MATQCTITVKMTKTARQMLRVIAALTGTPQFEVLERLLAVELDRLGVHAVPLLHQEETSHDHHARLAPPPKRRRNAAHP